MNFKDKKIVVLAPHTDDGELGCGGTISRALEEGAKLYYIALSTAEASVPKGFPKNRLEIEVKKACKTLKIPSSNLFIFRHEVRKLNYVRQEILESLVSLQKKIKPDIVFLPSSKDIHQDHITVMQEGIRAFKYSTILGYELIWNNLSFHTDCFIKLKKKHINAKVKALACYETQRGKKYMSEDFITSLAKVRGTQINEIYAETFELIRWIL